jgi:hypothetical protein
MVHIFNLVSSQALLLTEFLDALRVEANHNLDERQRGELGRSSLPNTTANTTSQTPARPFGDRRCISSLMPASSSRIRMNLPGR